jgi:hypothetical protein
LAIFMVPLLSLRLSALPAHCPTPTPVVWCLRFLLFKIMLGE